MKLTPFSATLTAIMLAIAWTGISTAAPAMDEEVPYESGAAMTCGTFFVVELDDPLVNFGCWDPSIPQTSIATEIQERWEDIYYDSFSCLKCTNATPPTPCEKYCDWSSDAPVFTADGAPGCWRISYSKAKLTGGCRGC